MIFREDDPKVKQYPYMAGYTDFLKPMERPLLGREREMRQLMAAMSRPELSNVILLAEAGTGKANSVSTILPVADDRGYINLGDVKVGDQVFDENGKPVTVLGVFFQGKLPAYEVIFEDGTSVICNNEHLWTARSMEQGDMLFHVHTLREMMIHGIVKHRETSQGVVVDTKEWYVPSNGAVERPAIDLPIEPYNMGVLLCNGFINARDKVVFKTRNTSLAERMIPELHSMDYTHSDENGFWYVMDAEDVFSVDDDTEKKEMRRQVFDLEYKRRRIPSVYLVASKEQRRNLLRGLMDQNGEVSVIDDKTFVVFHTNSEYMADSMQVLAASLGYRTKKMQRMDRYAVQLLVPEQLAVDLFSCSVYTEKLLNIINEKHLSFPDHYDVAISEVRYLDREEEMVCIYVDSPAHLFQISEHHIVTHNTALVQGTMQMDTERAYLEVNLPKMISNLHNENEMADKLKSLFHEVEAYRKEQDKEIVLFIDEFHQIVQLSSAAVEVLKPLLADSGTRGIRVIAATTYIEYQQHISANLPLVERLQRINLPQPTKEVVINILKGMAKRYGVDSQFTSDAMFEAIYEYTNRYIPANAQPRKSILMLDSMIGWHRADKRPIDMKLLADVIYETEGINIAFRVDATSIKERLDQVVIAQQFASTSIESRLQICCADLNNKNKPMSSFLFTGSTGVGKSTTCDTLIPVYDENGITRKRAGDVVPGDYVFDRVGKPTQVLGVFPQGKRDVYRVILADGRSLDVSDNHLWAVHLAEDLQDEDFTIYSTKTMLDKGLTTEEGMKYFIPMNAAVEWPEQNYPVHPYVMGMLIGNEKLSPEKEFILSDNGDFVVRKIAGLIGATSCEYKEYNWYFYTEQKEAVSALSIYGDYPELYESSVRSRRIPEAYMTGSIKQRWELIQGLFDKDGCICVADGSVAYLTGSAGLAYDIQDLLYSLGVQSIVHAHERVKNENGITAKHLEYEVCVKHADGCSYFSLPVKVEVAKKTCRKEQAGYVGIRSIEKLKEQADMVCFYVDNEEHLYQAGQYIVTHNTEMSKQLANILFEDERALVRMDMTEYALPDSLERFRLELTQAVWTRPYCIILLDEIEKACAPVTRILLQVLDDGRLLDRNNREVTFKNAYIIVTTNAGSEIYKNIAQYNADDTGSGKMLEKYESLIRDSIKGTVGGGKFPPELLGRIDCLVPFQPLSENTMATICLMKLNKLKEDIMKKHRISVLYHKRVIPYIVQDKMTTDSDAGGARGVVSRIEREVTTALAKYINAHPEARMGGRTLEVCVHGELVAENKNRISTDAYIEVIEQKRQ